MSATGLFHCSAKGIGRAKGRSVVAAAAYRHGERLADEISGKTADYRARGGVLDGFILTTAEASAWRYDRERFWNAAERVEPRANGRLATELELELALPFELTAAQRKELLSAFVLKIVEKYGVAADVAIHAPGEGRDHRNIHAHVLLTHRQLDADGFGDIANRRTITKQVKGQEKQIEIAGIAATPGDIKALRRDWEQHVNRAYELAGLDIRVDHRSHKDRGIEQEPTIHLGPAANAMEKDKPGSSDRAASNREIMQRNAERSALAALEVVAREMGAEIVDLKAERAMQEQREAAKGRTDDTRAEFTAAGARAAEPVAPIFDRDAADAAWADKVAAAGIDLAAERAMQEARDAARGRTDDVRAEPRAAAQEAAQRLEPDVGRETRAGAAEPSHGPQRDAAHEIVDAEPVTVEEVTRGLGSVLGGTLSGIAKPFENFFAALADMFAPPPPKTKDQAERAGRAAEEQREQNADAAHQQEKDERLQEILDRMEREREERESGFAARYGTPPSGRERDDDDRGRERER